ncbi:MAG: hypothetical protein A4E28_02072 [Methanocella sp. PtaU1.Bin125]|nr:MAG: hypothetical protein A4E28_02072 [Methanocella sp. PtaU1.Bin125]
MPASAAYASVFRDPLSFCLIFSRLSPDFFAASSAYTRNATVAAEKSTSAMWWSVNPSIDRPRNCPGSSASVAAATMPAFRPNSFLPMK